MLSGLHLRNFALAERVDLDVGSGFTAITGETGAGKSVLIQALIFALGAPADTEFIHPGSDSCEVEAVFQLAATAAEKSVASVLDDAGIPFDGELIVRRTLTRPQNGSNRLGGRLRINDRAATVGVLRQLMPLLADIHGQREHLSLLRPSEQLALLDRYAGVESLRDNVAEMVRCIRSLDKQLLELGRNERERNRRIALLRHEADEIEAAALLPDEESELLNHHRRLVNAQMLGQEANSAITSLEDDALGSALTALRRISAVDDEAAPIEELVEAATEQAAEAARMMRSYADRIDLEPARLTEVESRIALIGEMKRRWGDTLAEVIQYGEHARREADQLEQEFANIASVQQQADQLASDLTNAVSELSRRRHCAATELAAAVSAECNDLRLAGARIEFRFGRLASASGQRTLDVEGEQRGFDPSGIDSIELCVAFNPDAPPRPLQRVASGGETARLTLAIKAVLGESDVVPLMVFDEIDVGLGGRSGGMIGERMARLGERRQVICITHLPQVAANATDHICVSKRSEHGKTDVHVRKLAENERVIELAEMLGGATVANRASAGDLLQAVGAA